MKSSLILLLFSFLLYACGGGGGGSAAKNSLAEEEPQEQVYYAVSNKTINSVTDIKAKIRLVDGLNNIEPIYDVSTYKLEYLSSNSKDEEVKVSGLVAIPNTNVASPILSYQHGTMFKNKAAPSFHLKPDTKNPEILLASLGYIVFSPDYIGYGTSFGQDHPYLQKQASADIVIDMLKAAKAFLKKQNVATNNKLFMTGYSQGGYVTMAALEALQNAQEDDLTVTAAVMGAGPYDLYTTLHKLLPNLDNLPDAYKDRLITYLEKFVVKKGAEVKFERTFLQKYLDGDKSDDAHKWKPNIPLKLFHGKDDKVVPIEAAISTQNYMTKLGADVELVNCTAKPADHSNCSVPYVNYTINYFADFR